MRRRISVLVAIGFAFLLALGIGTNLAMIVGLRETMTRAEASQASALEVRASVRSLRADYLAMGDAVSRFMLEPAWDGAAGVKHDADVSASAHLAAAARATNRPDLKATLSELRRHDRHTTDRIEDFIIATAGSDPERARQVYLHDYLPARARNLTLVERALGIAVAEVAQTSASARQKAYQTTVFAWAALILFSLVGTVGGLRLSGAVHQIAQRFEEAAVQVREQRDHLHAVTTAMRDALAVTDARGTITMANHAICALLGFEDTELIGTPIRRCVDTSTMPLPSTDARNAPVAFVCSDGTRIPMSLSAAPVCGAEGQPAGTVWVARDMRDHLHMLAEVEAARDTALEGSRIKSEFLANVSHEIRTPMHVIIGYTDMALDSPVNDEQRWQLQSARRSAIALLDIINDILDLSKVEAGKLTLEDVPFGLRSAVDEMLEPLAIQARDKGLALGVTVAREVPERLQGDPTRLRQVLTNLVGNALKFTEVGAVTVSVAVEAPADTGWTMLHFTVSDTGIGIAVDKREIIFRAFTQADGSMTRRYGGTGLGLTIAARLVEMMGGCIWVESVVGTGSVFHFTARLRAMEAAGEGLVLTAAGGAGGRNG